MIFVMCIYDIMTVRCYKQHVDYTFVCVVCVVGLLACRHSSTFLLNLVSCNGKLIARSRQINSFDSEQTDNASQSHTTYVSVIYAHFGSRIGFVEAFSLHQNNIYIYMQRDTKSQLHWSSYYIILLSTNVDTYVTCTDTSVSLYTSLPLVSRAISMHINNIVL